MDSPPLPPPQASHNSHLKQCFKMAINPVDKIKLSSNTPHRRSATFSLETYRFIHFAKF